LTTCAQCAARALLHADADDNGIVVHESRDDVDRRLGSELVAARDSVFAVAGLYARAAPLAYALLLDAAAVNQLVASYVACCVCVRARARA
jgi:hypothetical protein